MIHSSPFTSQRWPKTPTRRWRRHSALYAIKESGRFFVTKKRMAIRRLERAIRPEMFYFNAKWRRVAASIMHSDTDDRNIFKSNKRGITYSSCLHNLYGGCAMQDAFMLNAGFWAQFVLETITPVIYSGFFIDNRLISQILQVRVAIYRS